MAEFRIAHRLVGDDHPPVVIAEIGINHEGSLDTAIEMVDAAIDAGAEIVKHQTHVVEDEMSEQTDVERVFASHSPSEVGGVFVVSPNLQTKFPAALVQVASEKRLTMMGFRREWVEKGALFSYAPDLAPMGRPAARYVDRILRGTRPADLPVQAPDSLELVVNLQVAQSLGLSIPQSALSQATYVIQ